jgi:hypothetical protein
LAALESRLLLSIHHKNLSTTVMTIEQIVAGTGPTYAFQNRLLGTFSVFALSELSGLERRTALVVLLVFAVACIHAVVFELARTFRRDDRVALCASVATGLAVLLLQDWRFVTLWDLIDIIVHSAGAFALVAMPSVRAFALIAAVGVWNRESAAFLGVACALSGVATRPRALDLGRIIGGTLIACSVLAITAYVRHLRAVFPPGPFTTAWGNSSPWRLNLQRLESFADHPSFVRAMIFAIPLLAAGWVAYLWPRTGAAGRRALAMPLVMFLAYALYSSIHEVRALCAAVPYLVFGVLARADGRSSLQTS